MPFGGYPLDTGFVVLATYRRNTLASCESGHSFPMYSQVEEDSMYIQIAIR